MILLAIISFASQASDRSHNCPCLPGTLDKLFLSLCYNISFLCVVGILAEIIPSHTCFSVPGNKIMQ